jgi:pyruvate dehydrogenase phosphatase
MRQPPPNLKTPPYVTPQPVITHRKLDFLPLDRSDNNSKSSPRSSLRFIVLATDGLWDDLTSSEVVALVGGHLAGIRGTAIPKRELNELVPTVTSSEALTVEGKEQRNKPNKLEGAWAFVDENVSTHLIRNAFGGADTRRLRRLLSIPAPLSRSYRDDVTVTVVWWEDGREGAPKMEETFKIQRKEKAKL